MLEDFKELHLRLLANGSEFSDLAKELAGYPENGVTAQYLITKLLDNGIINIPIEELNYILDAIVMSLTASDKHSLITKLYNPEGGSSIGILQRMISAEQQDLLDQATINERNKKNGLLKYLITHLEQLDPERKNLIRLSLVVFATLEIEIAFMFINEQISTLLNTENTTEKHKKTLKFLEEILGQIHLVFIDGNSNRQKFKDFSEQFGDHICVSLAEYYRVHGHYEESARYALFVQNPQVKMNNPILFACLANHFAPEYFDDFRLISSSTNQESREEILPGIYNYFYNKNYKNLDEVKEQIANQETFYAKLRNNS